jgi:hypothetical protein
VNDNCADWITAVAAVITAVCMVMQYWVFKKQRKDNLFKTRFDTYNDIITSCAEVYSFFDPDKKFEQMMSNFNSEQLKFNISDISGSQKLLAQVEYVFGASPANYIRNIIESGEIYKLGKIDIDTEKFQISKDIESLFEPFLKGAK